MTFSPKPKSEASMRKGDCAESERRDGHHEGAR